MDKVAYTIQRSLQTPAGLKVANEKTLILNHNIIIENRTRRDVHVNDQSVLIKGNRRQPHYIQRVGSGQARSACARDGGDFNQAPREGCKNALFFSAQLDNV
ncbi:MAG TPA: hypothetical protein VL996_04195 [Methylocella sp.]|nr:hypothetical protein [Methylocella sp.]